MERIWAPWRMAYLESAAPEDGCVFCAARDARGEDRQRLVLARREHSLIMLNRYPYTSAHLMVIPLRHTAEMDELDDLELLDLMRGVRWARRVLLKAARPEGFNVGINMGKAAGAGIDQHLHVHIVGRWSGDTNFMSVNADVRVIPEGLAAIYDRLLLAAEEVGYDE